MQFFVLPSFSNKLLLFVCLTMDRCTSTGCISVTRFIALAITFIFVKIYAMHFKYLSHRAVIIINNFLGFYYHQLIQGNFHHYMKYMLYTRRRYCMKTNNRCASMKVESLSNCQCNCTLDCVVSAFLQVVRDSRTNRLNYYLEWQFN